MGILDGHSTCVETTKKCYVIISEHDDKDVLVFYKNVLALDNRNNTTHNVHYN